MSDLFISPADATVRTLAGQSFEFKAGVPTYVSPQAQPEVRAAGCISAGEPAAEIPATDPIDPAAEAAPVTAPADPEAEADPEATL